MAEIFKYKFSSCNNWIELSKKITDQRFKYNQISFLIHHLICFKSKQILFSLNSWFHHDSQQPQIEKNVNQNILFYLNLKSKGNIILTKTWNKNRHTQREIQTKRFSRPWFHSWKHKVSEKIFRKSIVKMRNENQKSINLNPS